VRLRAEAADEVAEQALGVGSGLMDRPDELNRRWSIRLGSSRDPERRVDAVGGVRGPALPGGDDGGRLRGLPLQAERRAGRGRHGAQRQRRDDAELPPAGAAQRPEQVGMVVGVALDDAAVGEDDPRRDEPVAREAVAAAEDADAATERQPGDAHRGAAARRDGAAVAVEGVIQGSQPDPGAHDGDLVREVDGVHRRDVDHDARGAGPPGEAVAAAARRDGRTKPTRHLQGMRGVVGSAAPDDRQRTELLVGLGHQRRPERLVRLRAGQHHVAVDRRPERPQLHGGRSRAGHGVGPHQ